MIMAEPHPIQESQLKRFATAAYSEDVPIRMIRQMASELLSLRQQIGQRQAELEFIMQKNMEAAKQEPAQAELLEVALAMRDWIDAVPQNTQLPTMPGFDRDWANAVIDQAKKQEPAQAVPVYECRVKHVHFKNWSPWTECDKAEYDQYQANPNDGDGWTYETRMLYAHPAPLDSDTRKLVLELCAQVIRNSGEYKHIPGTVEAMAADIIERLEAGE